MSKQNKHYSEKIDVQKIDKSKRALLSESESYQYCE